VFKVESFGIVDEMLELKEFEACGMIV
jgi:hypothetical protein